MIEICGKQVRDTLQELLDPATTALVVIDMQEGAVNAGGAIGDSGHDLSMMPDVAKRCGRAIEAARKNGVPVFHIRVENLPDGGSSPAAWLRALYTAANGRPIDLGKLSLKGDPATEFCAECLPEDGEVIITKRRPSAFVGTELALRCAARASNPWPWWASPPEDASRPRCATPSTTTSTPCCSRTPWAPTTPWSTRPR